MQLKFLLDHLTMWQRVVLLYLLTIRQPSWWLRKELHWCLRESFISNDLGMSFVWPWSFMALRDTVSSEPLIDDICYHENVRHDVVASRCLVLVDNMRDSVFKGDESRHLIGWYEVSCTLLLISLLAWVLEKLNARSLLTLLEAHWFVRPLPMSASIIDPFCVTCLISLCSIAEVVVAFCMSIPNHG